MVGFVSFQIIIFVLNSSLNTFFVKNFNQIWRVGFAPALGLQDRNSDSIF